MLSVDGRARRKRRQYSSASYYLAGVAPYANPNVDPGSLTYPSGSFYDSPGYGYTNPEYGANPAYTGNQYNTGLNQYAQQYPYNNRKFMCSLISTMTPRHLPCSVQFEFTNGEHPRYI